MGWRESDEEFSERMFRLWCKRHGVQWNSSVFSVSAEEVRRIHENAVNAFNRECDRLEKEETDIKVKQLLGATLGHHTFEVEVERG